MVPTILALDSINVCVLCYSTAMGRSVKGRAPTPRRTSTPRSKARQRRETDKANSTEKSGARGRARAKAPATRRGACVKFSRPICRILLFEVQGCACECRPTEPKARRQTTRQSSSLAK